MQYEELEALLPYANEVSFPPSDWPLIPVDYIKKKDAEEVAEEGPWVSPCKQGEAVLQYSINHARMKVLKNKLSKLELHQYIFARECYFLFSLGKASACAERGVSFITSIRAELQGMYDAKKRDAALEAVRDSAVRAAQQRPGAPSPSSGVADNSKWADLWAIVASVQLARYCKSSILATATATSPAPVQELSAVEDTNIVKVKESSRALSDLLQYAKKLLTNILTSEESSFQAQRNLSLAMTAGLTSWDALDKLKTLFNGMDIAEAAVQSDSLSEVRLIICLLLYL